MRSVLQILRTAYELYKRDDLLSDLTVHFRRQDGRGGNAARCDLSGPGIASLLWWGDDRDEAIAELTKVVDVRTGRVGTAARPGRVASNNSAAMPMRLAVLDAVQPHGQCDLAAA